MRTMKRVLTSCSAALAALALSAGAAQADVKTHDKSQIKVEGMLGRMMGMFGGKVMKEGVVSTNAIKGDRKITMDESTGRIVDMREEKVYTLDLKKKSYSVMTFAELRQQLRDAQEKARRDAEASAKESAGKDKPAQADTKDKAAELEVDFDVKETGQTKKIAGYDTHESVMTITVREKGKTLEDSGGIVVSSSLWLGPEIPAMKELGEFELRYWKAIAPEMTGFSAEQMAAITAMYPLVKPAIDRLNQEKGKLRGTALSTVTTFDVVKSREQLAQSKSNEGGGGLSGMLANRIMKKDDNKPRATIFTITGEVLDIATTVAAADVDVPAGFKLVK